MPVFISKADDHTLTFTVEADAGQNSLWKGLEQNQVNDPVNDVHYNASIANTEILDNGIKIIDNDSVNKRFVFNDDNLIAYQLSHLGTPASNYPSIDWQACTISNIIVPLYSKIYLEAFKAKPYIKNLLTNSPIRMPDNAEAYMRCYLASSRSYKHYLALNESFDKKLKELILSISLPKFI